MDIYDYYEDSFKELCKKVIRLVNEGINDNLLVKFIQDNLLNILNNSMDQFNQLDPRGISIIISTLYFDEMLNKIKDQEYQDDVSYTSLNSEIKNLKMYINQLELNIFEVENLKDTEIQVLKNQLKEFEIKNHKLIKEIDYLNDYINDLEKYN